jgi:hypothetical protein
VSEPAYYTPEFWQTLERIRQGTDHGNEKLRPDFDPKLAKDVAEHFIRGRKIDAYRPALERAGFTFYHPSQLPPLAGGGPRLEGEWRNARMRLAFTDRDILGSSDFSNPQEFAEWIAKVKLARRLAAQGLRVVDNRLIDRRRGR